MCVGAWKRGRQTHTAVGSTMRGDQASECVDGDALALDIGARDRPAPNGGADRGVSDMLRGVHEVHVKLYPDPKRGWPDEVKR